MNLREQERYYQTFARSRAAATKEDTIVTEIVDGLIISKPAKKIEHLSTSETRASEPIVIDLQRSKAGFDVTKYYYMSLPSSGDQVYKCGTHDYETKNLTEFNRHVENHGSKAASIPGINKVREIHDFLNAKR